MGFVICFYNLISKDEILNFVKVISAQVSQLQVPPSVTIKKKRKSLNINAKRLLFSETNFLFPSAGSKSSVDSSNEQLLLNSS